MFYVVTKYLSLFSEEIVAPAFWYLSSKLSLLLVYYQHFYIPSIGYKMFAFINLLIFLSAAGDDSDCGEAVAFTPKQKPKYKLIPVADCAGFNN